MFVNSKLLKAVLKRNLAGARECIEEDGEDLNVLVEHERNILHLSVSLRCDDLLEYFLKKGLDPNKGDADKITPLHWACKTGRDTSVELLLKHGAHVNVKAKESITPLHVASANGHTKCVQKLCEKSEPKYINCKDDNGHTALHYAANEGHNETLALLIKQGCDVNAANIAGNKPLHFAAAWRSSEACQTLVQNDETKIDAQNLIGQTALHLATLQASPKIVNLLLKSGADPNIRDIKGDTCVHLAIKEAHIELIKMFLDDDRTDTSIGDDSDNTVIHLALKLGHFNLIPMMLPRAKDLTKQDGNGCSVIIEAIKNQLEDLALEMLKTCPSLVHTTTNELVTPLHLAAERGMTNLTQQLLLAGASVGATDSNGLTPSLYCAKNDSVLECLAMIEDIMIADSPSTANE